MTLPSKSEAVNWATKTESEILNGHRGIVRSGSTLLDAFVKYKKEVSIGKKSKRSEIIRIERFERTMTFAIKQLKAIKSDDIERWKSLRLKSVKESSVRREFVILNSVFSHCVEKWGWLHQNPMSKIEWPKDSKPRTRRVHWTEVRQICRKLGYSPFTAVNNLSKETALAFMFALRSGMRSSEILQLKQGDIDFKVRVAHLYKTKNGYDRDVPLTKSAIRLLLKLPKRPDGVNLFNVSSASRDALFRAARDEAKIKNLHFHDSRAEALTVLSKKVDVMTLARISGHRSIKVLVDTYYRETAAQIAARL